MPKQLKKSKYAAFIEKEDGTIIAYSSWSGAVIAFTEPSYIERLKLIIKQEIITDSNDEIVSVLKSKFFMLIFRWMRVC